MNKLISTLTFLLIATICSCQTNNSLIGYWQGTDNPSNYIHFTEKEYFEINDSKKYGVSITKSFWGFSNECNIHSKSDLKKEGSFLLTLLKDFEGNDPTDYFCYGYSFPSKDQLHLEVWASNQSINYKKIKVLPKHIQLELEKKK